MHHFQYHKHSFLPFRLTSAFRYVVVLKDNVIDLETVSGNLCQNSASPEDSFEILVDLVTVL